MGQVARARRRRGPGQSSQQPGPVAGRGYGMMTASAPDRADQAPRRGVHAPGIVEQTCMLMSGLALVVLLVLVGVDVVTRWAFNFSFEVSDEVGAYMLVAITFLGLPVSHIHGAFHRVEFIQARLSRRARLISRFGFDVLSLRRPRPDLPGDAALDTKIATGDWHGGAVPVAGQVPGCRPQAFAG